MRPNASLAALPSTIRQLSPRWLLPVAVLLLLYGLNYAPFWNPDEGRYASTALEMTQPFDGDAPDWITPHLNTIPRLNKPPLVYWLTALSYRAFGASETAGRLVSAVAAIIVLLTLYALGRAMFSEQAGILGALTWSVSVLPFSMAHILNTDMLLCGAMTLTFCGLWLGLRDEEASAERNLRERWPGYALMGLGLGIALLTKGPVGVALPLAITFVYLCGARRWPNVSWPGTGLSITIALLLALPWYGAVAVRHPDFLKLFLLQENVARFTGAQEFHRAKPVWFYAPVLLLGLLPWTAYLLPALARWHVRPGTTAQQQARLYLWLWAGLLLLFFSFSKVKLISYALPAFPALALLLGETLSENNDGSLTVPYRVATALTAFIYLVLLVALPLAFLHDHITLVGHVRHLPGDKIMPIGEMRPFILVGCGVLGVGLLFLVWQWRRAQIWHTALTHFATGGVLFITLVNLTCHIARYEDNSGMLKALRPFLQPADRVIQYQTFLPSSSFYLGQPVTIVGFPHSSGLDEAVMAHSKFFLNDKQQTLAQLLNSPQHLYIFIDAGNPAWRALRQPYYVIAQSNGCRLLSNRPAPPGLYYDFVAPHKRSD